MRGGAAKGVFQWFPYNLNGANSACAGADITFSAGTLVLTGCGTTLNGEIVSGTPAGATVGTTWHGTAFGGGMYAQATMLFQSATLTGSTGWPAWWGQPYETTTLYANSCYDTWGPGGDSPQCTFHHSVEIDFMEYISGNEGMSLHETYGIPHTVTTNCNPGAATFCLIQNGPGNFTLPNLTVAHTYGMLWVPAAGGNPGYVQSDVDGVVQTIQKWPTAFSTSFNPPPAGLPANSGGVNAGASWTFGAVDLYHYLLILGTGTGTGAQPLTITNVQVWQSGPGNNVVN